MPTKNYPISRFNILSGYSLDFNYIYTPKNACSTLKATLIKQTTNPHKIAQDLYGNNKVDPDKAFFIITRNPFHRFKSAFLDKIGFGNDPYVWGEICSRYNLDPNASIGPEKLLDFFLNDCPGEIEPHFRPQHILHNYAYLKPAYIGRFEKFSAIKEFISKKGYEVRTWAPHARSSKANSFIFSDAITSKIIRLYSDDFIFYDYDQNISSTYSPNFIEQTQELSDDFRLFCEQKTSNT